MFDCLDRANDLLAYLSIIKTDNIRGKITNMDFNILICKYNIPVLRLLSINHLIYSQILIEVY